MRPLRNRRLFRSALTALFPVLIAATSSPARADPAAVPPTLVATSATADVSDAQIAASNEKIGMAYRALVELWQARFAQFGARFVPPRLMAYRGPVRTDCGVMRADNAAYCVNRNAIYYDEVFLARLAGAAANELRTDGDMAAIGVIAHEMGHAVVSQLGAESRIPYKNEAAADCLAGVFTKESEHVGTLEAGDLDEAFFGLAAAGDPTPQLTGDQRIDRRIVTRAALLGHGTRDQRLANFREGYTRGAGACVSELRS
ncbi:MAG: neutral zinc metallopeptidase [Gemmatimonadaceae bacterium]